jgi:hypothetical protein
MDGGCKQGLNPRPAATGKGTGKEVGPRRVGKVGIHRVGEKKN